MGRRAAVPHLTSRVRSARQAVGLSQGQLATASGLTRQAISSIESGHYIPNTAVALRLAQVLRCRVEDLFHLPEPAQLADIQFVTHPATLSRIAVARVDSRWVGYPLASGWEVQVGFTSADALVDQESQSIRLLGPLDRLEKTAVLLGCDPSLGILSRHLLARNPDAHLLWLPASSQAALDALGRGEAHLAGTHLHEEDAGKFNVSYARRALARTGGVVVAFARWEQGLVVAPGNPKAIHTVADLARPDVRLINRELGSGSRALLDALLTRNGVPAEAVQGYSQVVSSHLAAALAVASGGVDAAVALRATAHALGLGFVPLDEVRFDLVIPHAQREHPTVACLLELLQSTALRAELGALPGYDIASMGSVIADLPALPNAA